MGSDFGLLGSEVNLFLAACVRCATRDALLVAASSFILTCKYTKDCWMFLRAFVL
uniref:Uncharacterized protein n=1 Tax=Arundo donax TaxID=35708 RepID=A0A0A8ZCX0_ARUDO